MQTKTTAAAHPKWDLSRWHMKRTAREMERTLIVKNAIEIAADSAQNDRLPKMLKTLTASASRGAA